MDILFISANSADAYMDIEREQRTLQQLTSTGPHSLHVLPATEVGDLREALLSNRKSRRFNILHFSGHATNDGLHLRGGGRKKALLDIDSLKAMLKDSGIELVVLNACESQTIAESLSDTVPDVVGTTRKVRDVVARQFTRNFYAAMKNNASVDKALAAALEQQRTSITPAYVHVTGNTHHIERNEDYDHGQREVYV